MHESQTNFLHISYRNTHSKSSNAKGLPVFHSRSSRVFPVEIYTVNIITVSYFTRTARNPQGRKLPVAYKLAAVRERTLGLGDVSPLQRSPTLRNDITCGEGKNFLDSLMDSQSSSFASESAAKV